MRLYLVYDDDDDCVGYCDQHSVRYWQCLGYYVEYWGNFWS